ncbi:MAG: hypothetical protein J7M09_04540, partial [Deltaproteobacteria bacterium]|nr:hypothetical protein [Candidatus Tharpella sp.]
MNNELIVTFHVKNILAADSVIKESLITDAGEFGKHSTCKQFLQVQSLLKQEGEGMTDNLPDKPHSEIVIYQAEDGQSRIQVHLQDETVWLTQKLMSELFQKDVRTINEHIKNIYDEDELEPESTIRKFRIV